jgi:hypothetical protein
MGNCNCERKDETDRMFRSKSGSKKAAKPGQRKSRTKTPVLKNVPSIEERLAL